jgi:asparagine synthase (glutamine-hydrolysing)
MAKGMAVEFWKQGLDRAGEPGFSHEPRWRTTAMLKRFYSPGIRERMRAAPAPDVLGDLPPEFSSWDGLEQAQYLEIATLLSGYLISSQGDRMLMAHSVEGRFPFLDADVMEFSNALAPDLKLAGLTEKRILKKLGREVLPREIVERPKQPYRAPDAVSLMDSTAAPYVADTLSEQAIRSGGMFDPSGVSQLYQKCRQRVSAGNDAAFSNADNMSLVGIVTSQLLHQLFVASPSKSPDETFQLTVDVETL